MALGTTNITTTNVGTEIGSSSRVVSVLVGASGLNKYSYYAAGQLGVDGSKNITLTPPTSNFKLGDFRLYDNSAVPPAPQAAITKNYGPSSGAFSFTIVYMLSTLNIKAFTTPADYVTVKCYSSSADRIAESNVKFTQTFAISYISDTPLAGHSRLSATKPSTTGWQAVTLTSFSDAWLTNNCIGYFDTYLSNISGTRVINFGTSVSAGYTNITFHLYSIPYLYGLNTNTPTAPAGYTVVFPTVSASATPVCSYSNSINQTFGGTTYDFYVVAKAVYVGGTRIVGLTSTNIILTKGGVRTTCATGVAIGYTTGYHCTGTLASGGTWGYDDTGTVTFESATIPSVPSYTQC